MIKPPGRKWIPVLILLLVLSVFWTILSIKPKPEVEPAKTPILTVRHEYSVVTQKALKAWPPGTILEPGMAAYFYAAAPMLSVTPVIELSGLENGALSGYIDTAVIVKAIDDKSRVYWSYTTVRPKRQSFTQNDDGQNTPALTPLDPIDVSAVYETVSQINEELAFYSGLLQMVVSSEIVLNGVVNGASVNKNIAQDLSFPLQPAGFSAPGPNELTLEIPLLPENQSVPQNTLLYNARENPFPFLLDGLLAFALILLLLKKNATRPAVEHRRFREWITEGIVEVRDKTAINILSLEGLVDLAIDLDKRVIYDPKVGKYFVLTEDLIYVYDPERSHALTENRPQLGELLLSRGLISPEQLEIGLFYQKKIGGRLGESLVALGFIDETTLYAALAAQLNVDFYEPTPADIPADISWLDKLSLQRARAMMVLPLGTRSDGKLVVACSEVSREGIRDALGEIFKKEIHLTAARPSAIYQALYRLETHMKEKRDENTGSSGCAEFLTVEEKERFTSSYIRGILVHELLFKASGWLTPDMAQRVQDDPYLKNSLPAELYNLMMGLDKSVAAMDWKDRQKWQVPGLMDLLHRSNYLTSSTMDWVQREVSVQEISEEKLLQQNFLVSGETIRNALFLLAKLQDLLTPGSKSP